LSIIQKEHTVIRDNAESQEAKPSQAKGLGCDERGRHIRQGGSLSRGLSQSRAGRLWRLSEPGPSGETGTKGRALPWVRSTGP
jgi:hypothetical protein